MERDVLMALESITKTYDMGEVKVEALRETSLEIYQGELVCILGPSGSGKSTLLNILGGMDQPTSGIVRFRDRELSRATETQLTNYRRKYVGFVFQFYNLVPDLTARENVEMAAALVGKPMPVAEALDLVGLAERMDHFPSQLSGGEQQRVSIARAAVKKAPIMLCDEPTGALDYETGKVILELLADINQRQNTTVVLVTHNTPIAAMADRVIRMRSGRIVEIKRNENPVPPERIEW
ncbi:MAG: ABC transporter ATP-binding protein [Solirubrobacterales bacterium]